MIDRKIDSGATSLTSRDKEMRRVGPELNLVAHPPIALTDMTGGIVPLRDVPQGREIYGELAQASLSVFTTRNESGEQEFIMVGPSLTAEQVNGLLYFAAPYKMFGFDTQDIINDWTDLYNKPMHAKRKKAHANMPGWSQFEASREKVLGVLERNYRASFRKQDTSDTIVPVLRWKKDAEGKNHIIIEPLDEGLQIALADALPDQITDPSRLDGGMGLMYVAAYSPDQTQWLSSDGYKYNNAEKTQVIGPTQVLAYAYREVSKKQADPNSVLRAQDMQESPLLDGLGDYAETGQVPSLQIAGSPVASFAPPVFSQPTPIESLLQSQSLVKKPEVPKEEFKAEFTDYLFNKWVSKKNPDKVTSPPGGIYLSEYAHVVGIGEHAGDIEPSFEIPSINKIVKNSGNNLLGDKKGDNSPASKLIKLFTLDEVGEGNLKSKLPPEGIIFQNQKYFKEGNY